MRKTITCAMTVVLTAGLPAGCSAGPNHEAVVAATTYSEKLTEWSQQLSTAAETARTATSAEWTAAGEGELGFEEVPLGEVLESAPKLKEFEPSEVENTPTYRTAVRVAEQVDAITEELAGMEPKALKTLRVASFDSYWIVADLYYNTLSGPGGDRLDARTEAWNHTDDWPTFNKIQRTASLGFGEGRLGLIDIALDEMAGTVEEEDRPIIPESGLGVSIGAFIVDWLLEEKAFQEDWVEEVGSWATLGGQYDVFWNFGNVNATFTAPAEYAAELRTAFVTQVAEIAAGFSTSTDPSADSNASPKLPAIGDPYRQVLLDGYLPWGDPAQNSAYTADRLWLLWHIRELEETPDAAYAAARAALMEELNRHVEEGQTIDFRPGSGRLLTLIEANDTKLLFGADVTTNNEALAAAEELLGFGEVLRSYPMTPEVSASFDAVLDLYTELTERMAAAIEGNPDEFDQWFALDELYVEYEQKILDEALSSLEALEDDAQAKALTAAAIESTAPGAASPSPTPTP